MIFFIDLCFILSLYFQRDSINNGTIYKNYNDNPNPKEISKVVDALKKGGLIIYPTDTVYGLGCDITNAKALEKIARIKGIKAC